ncbi:MAG: deoxyribodipyrimidine photo-lyase [Thermodesulfobacteriota bacterium]|nr:deoxyribodipyrimidine photo-lyase [Thermodesulfobacteriota bacterium]
MSTDIHRNRITKLNKIHTGSGDYVLYWMQQSQRAEYNHTLEFSVQQANRMSQPLLVVFALTDQYPDANLRHFTFLLEGLQQTQMSLADRGIKMVVQKGEPAQVALQLAQGASLFVCDRGYLGHQKEWRKKLAQKASCPVFQIESDLIVPVEAVSSKAEYAARTIRPKIRKLSGEYLRDFQYTIIKTPSLNIDVHGLDLSNIDVLLNEMNINRDVHAVSDLFRGGSLEAEKTLKDFIEGGLPQYHINRNQPQTDDISHMSMYLHFGQISPLYIAMEIEKADSACKEAKEAFLDELLVQRELAANFVHHTPHYDSFHAVPDWARKTLQQHQSDTREYVYDIEELEVAETHDDYWNAAMLEMKHTGFMHNYMRMYWGKKILEWSRNPEQAFRTALFLNNKYFLDGRDPNSYAGVAWIFGLHDRPWKNRPIFGSVRYMASSGLERKCDIQSYVKKVKRVIHDTGLS